MAIPLIRVAVVCASAGYTYWRLKCDEREALSAAARDARQD
jgi:hypothetical protein